ncbi:hypothetical protein PI124_g24338, partial [Phytophthora idaei]
RCCVDRVMQAGSCYHTRSSLLEPGECE